MAFVSATQISKQRVAPEPEQASWGQALALALAQVRARAPRWPAESNTLAKSELIFSLLQVTRIAPDEEQHSKLICSFTTGSRTKQRTNNERLGLLSRLVLSTLRRIALGPASLR